MRRRTFDVSAVAGMILAVLGFGLAAADPVRVPGTKVSLQPPPGFSPADKFPGFQRPELQASIMVTELPAPAAEMMKAMTKEGLASRGMTLLSSQTEKVDGRDALLLHVAQTGAGTEYLKWMLVTGDSETSLLIVGIFPKSTEAELGAAIRSSVLTTSFKADGASDPWEGLGFHVTPTPKLKLAGRVSNLLMLTETGSTGPLGPSEALYIVGNSIGHPAIGDLKSFSEARARQTEKIQDLQGFSGRALEVDAMAAYELLAAAKDTKTGAAIRLYQVIAAEEDGYFIIQGLVGAEREAEMLPEFRRLTESFRRTSGE